MSSLANNYNRRKISFKKGKGSFLYSSKGIKYLDFIQGIAVNSLGHSNSYLNKALLNQSRKVWHVSNAFEIPEGEKLAKRLTKNTFADYVIFQNSGAEATEVAIKVARKYFYSKRKPYKNRILCIKNSFHGRTLAAIHASGSKKMTEGFGPKIPGFDHFIFGDHKSLKKSITKKTAAIMVEPVLGEGGIKVIPKWCLKGLRKICDQKKILLICDEVQCGIGRSGKFFAFEYSGIKPDIVPIAKGIHGPKIGERLSPRVFDRQWPAFERRMQKWPPDRILTLMTLVAQTDAQCRTAGSPQEALVGKLLLDVAQVASHAGRRRA